MEHPITPPPELPTVMEILAARPLLEQVARLGDCIGANTVGEIMAISNRAVAWLEANPPGQPVAIEPRGCPTPGACSCVEPATPPPEPPKNCWLDDEPDLLPSPCVFDDPDEVINNCTYARTVKCKTDCKYYRVVAHPEQVQAPAPEPPTDAERLADFAKWLAREMPPNTIIGDPLWWAPRIARAVLERWGHH